MYFRKKFDFRFCPTKAIIPKLAYLENPYLTNFLRKKIDFNGSLSPLLHDPTFTLLFIDTQNPNPNSDHLIQFIPLIPPQLTS